MAFFRWTPPVPRVFIRPPSLSDFSTRSEMPSGLTLIEQEEWKAKQPREIPRNEFER